MGVSVGGIGVAVTTRGVGVNKSGVAEGMGVSITTGIIGEVAQAERRKVKTKRIALADFTLTLALSLRERELSKKLRALCVLAVLSIFTVLTSSK